MYSFRIKCANVNIAVYGNLMVESNLLISPECIHKNVMIPVSEADKEANRRTNYSKITLPCLWQ